MNRYRLIDCASNLSCSSFMIFLLIIGYSSMAFAQGAQNPVWSGQAQCDIHVQGGGYSHHETHTWKLSGQPTQQGALSVYTASWSVTGSGSLQKTQGTQTLRAQWTTSASAPNGPIATFVRVSDGKLIIKAYHGQLRVQGGVTGTQQLTIDGVNKPPGVISTEAFEWEFPLVTEAGTSTSVNGSSTMPINGRVGPMQPADARGTADCSWQYAKGALSPAGTEAGQSSPPPGSTTGASGTGASGQNQPSSGAQTPTLTVTGPSGVNLNSMTASVTLHLTGRNTHWVNATTVGDMGGGGVTVSIAVTDATHAEATVSMDPIAPGFLPGQRTIKVTTGAEMVSAPTLQIDSNLLFSSVVPWSVPQGGQNIAVGLSGSFSQMWSTRSQASADFGPGITLAGPVTLTSPRSATATINVAKDAPWGRRDVTLKTTPSLSTTGSGAFAVVADPSEPASILEVTPSVLVPGVEVDIALVGKNTHWQSGKTTISMIAGTNNLIGGGHDATVTDATHAKIHIAWVDAPGADFAPVLDVMTDIEILQWNGFSFQGTIRQAGPRPK